jgi:hypothetical protein
MAGHDCYAVAAPAIVYSALADFFKVPTDCWLDIYWLLLCAR